MAKKKRKDENEFLDETQWCVKYREYWQPDGRWCWDNRCCKDMRSDAIRMFNDIRLRGRAWWIAKRKAGVVACVKVKLVEQP